MKFFMMSSIFTLVTIAGANSIPTAETVASFDNIRPANIAISNNGRMFVTGHPIVGSDKKVIEVSKIGKNSVYPNIKYADSSNKNNSIIKDTIGITVDSKDNLWLLDMSMKQFVVWDIGKNKLNKIIKIPESVIKTTSFLQDFILDEKRNRLIIADMTQADLKSKPTPAFIVVDINTGKASRFAESHFSMMPDIEGGFALNPISIDPSFSWVYFGALNGKKIYRVPASSFNDEESVLQNIEFYAPKPYSDGIKVDEKENVYITDIEKQAIGLSNKSGYKVISMLPEGQTWPDGLVIKDNYLYAVVNQLNRTAALNNGVDVSKPPYLIIKTKIK